MGPPDIFGAPWISVELQHVADYLAQASDEPLLWEAKGTRVHRNEVRQQVFGFANSHEGGFLILGAEAAKKVDDAGEQRVWRLTGVEFPGEPRTWISDLITDPERGVRPLPDFDVHAWAAQDGRHVAVVRIRPVSAPPSITNGTVYERSPGRTAPVTDPGRLASLFARGDNAHREAQARADRAASVLLEREMTRLKRESERERKRQRQQLEGQLSAAMIEKDEREAVEAEQKLIRFAVGVATIGTAADIAARLFRTELSERLWMRLRDRPSMMPVPLRSAPEPVDWSQSAVSCRHFTHENGSIVTVARASWDGAAGYFQRLATPEAYPDSLAEGRIQSGWRLAEDLVRELGGYGDAYVTVILAGGSWYRRDEFGETDDIVIRRGPIAIPVTDAHIQSLGRELSRAVGNYVPEP